MKKTKKQVFEAAEHDAVWDLRGDDQAAEEKLKELYDNWALTFEGLDENDAPDVVEFFYNEGASHVELYILSGSQMNEICQLTDSNAYPEDLTIVSLEQDSNVLALQIGARWMTDIIDNNARREMYHPFNPDFFSEENVEEYNDTVNQLMAEKDGFDRDDIVYEVYNRLVDQLRLDSSEVFDIHYNDDDQLVAAIYMGALPRGNDHLSDIERIVEETLENYDWKYTGDWSYDDAYDEMHMEVFEPGADLSYNEAKKVKVYYDDDPDFGPEKGVQSYNSFDDLLSDIAHGIVEIAEEHGWEWAYFDVLDDLYARYDITELEYLEDKTRDAISYSEFVHNLFSGMLQDFEKEAYMFGAYDYDNLDESKAITEGYSRRPEMSYNEAEEQLNDINYEYEDFRDQVSRLDEDDEDYEEYVQEILDEFSSYGGTFDEIENEFEYQIEYLEEQLQLAEEYDITVYSGYFNNVGEVVNEIAEIAENLKEAVDMRDYPAGEERVDIDFNGVYYYYNGNDGTDFDWTANDRTCEIRAENENFDIEFFIKPNGYIAGFVWKHNSNELVMHLYDVELEIRESLAIEIARGLYQYLDEANRWDEPIFVMSNGMATSLVESKEVGKTVFYDKNKKVVIDSLTEALDVEKYSLDDKSPVLAASLIDYILKNRKKLAKEISKKLKANGIKLKLNDKNFSNEILKELTIKTIKKLGLFKAYFLSDFSAVLRQIHKSMAKTTGSKKLYTTPKELGGIISEFNLTDSVEKTIAANDYFELQSYKNFDEMFTKLVNLAVDKIESLRSVYAVEKGIASLVPQLIVDSFVEKHLDDNMQETTDMLDNMLKDFGNFEDEDTEEMQAYLDQMNESKLYSVLANTYRQTLLEVSSKEIATYDGDEEKAEVMSYYLNGLAYGMTIEELAEMHNVPVEQIEEQLEMGIEVEYEHTEDLDVATSIAMDHVFELPDYYDRLAKMEAEGKAELNASEPEEKPTEEELEQLDEAVGPRKMNAHGRYDIDLIEQIREELEDNYGYKMDIQETRIIANAIQKARQLIEDPKGLNLMPSYDGIRVVYRELTDDQRMDVVDAVADVIAGTVEIFKANAKKAKTFSRSQKLGGAAVKSRRSVDYD